MIWISLAGIRLPTLKANNRQGLSQTTNALPSNNNGSKLKSNYHSLRKDDIYGEHRVQLPPLISQSGGLSGLGTDQFTDNDRFAAMVKFLSHRDVLEKVSSY